MLEWCNGCTPGVQGATGPHSLVQLAYSDLLQLLGVRLRRAVQIHTAGRRKCRSLHIVYHGLVNMFELSNGRTPGVQGATGPPSFVQLLYTESTRIVMDRFVGGVQSRTAGVRKCRSLQIVRHLVYKEQWKLSV